MIDQFNKHSFLKDYEGFTRCRVGGLLIRDQSVLLIKQQSMFNKAQEHWIPPGGGVRFQEPVEKAVIREFLEETGVHVLVKDLLYIHEFIFDRVHAVEFFFRVEESEPGEVRLGEDPELPPDMQILRDIRWIPLDAVADLSFVPSSLAKRLKPDYDNRFAVNPVWLDPAG